MTRWLTLLPSFLLLVACSDFYSANVVGFVKRSRQAPDGDGPVAGPGINDVQVRIYLSEPSSFDDGSFVAETVSAENRPQGLPGEDGYYNHRIAWEADGDYGKDGDNRAVWIATSHPGYEPAVVRFGSVLSDTVNLVPDVVLTPTRVGPDLVTGRVVLDGVGQNGVQVALTLEGEDGDAEHVVRTGASALDEELTGVYEFTDVRWSGAADESREATVRVVGPDFVGDQELRVELTPDQVVELDEPIRVRPTIFTAPRIQGRVVDALGAGVDGVEMALIVEGDTALERRMGTVTTTLDGEEGVYRFESLTWSIGSDDPPSAEDVSGVRTVQIQVADERFAQDTADGEPLSVVVADGQELTVGQELLVHRSARDAFSAPIEGRCVARLDGVAEGLPLAGVEVTLAYRDDAGSHTLVDLTDAAGEYAFFVEWTRTDASPDAPAGEDALDATLSFADLEVGGDVYVFEDVEHELRSWIRPNRIVDAVGATP